MSQEHQDEAPAEVGAGYPENAETPDPGTGIDPRDHAENKIPAPDAPKTSKDEDGDPGQATGNPRAAGG
ncbi:MAG TPA: hypothetical protein VMY78_03715 [Solirubrobacteraceae bacterium]|nr:hypothetical protein [Solirubrobacteraceae bacterium]